MKREYGEYEGTCFSNQLLAGFSKTKLPMLRLRNREDSERGGTDEICRFPFDFNFERIKLKWSPVILTLIQRPSLSLNFPSGKRADLAAAASWT